MLRCTKMSLQDSEADAAALEFLPGTCRALSPCWVMRVRDGERWPGWVEANARQPASNARHPAWPFVSSTLLQEVSLPHDLALGAVVRRGPAGATSGTPRGRPQPAALPLARLRTARGGTGGG